MPEAPSLVRVAVRNPARQPVRRTASLTAEFRAYQQVDLHAKISGYLRRITVDAGSVVRAGDLIAVLEAPELTAELEQAGAVRQRAESEVTRAKAESARFVAAVDLARLQHERLVAVNRKEAGLIAQQEVDEALARRQSAEAQLSAARAMVTVAEQQVAASRAAEQRIRTMLEYTKITAPFAGTIVKRYADPGALIQAGTASSTQALPLVRLAEMNRLRLVANVPEGLTGSVKPGQAVQVKVPALNLSVPARFARFTETLQAATRTTEVEIDMVRGAHGFLPGMMAEVVAEVDSRADSLTVPVQAVANLGGNRSVLVVGPGGALEERAIKTGFEGATDLEVVSGLGPEDQVVVSNRTLLQPGMKVDAQREAAQR